MRTLMASAAGAVLAGLMLAACGSSGGSPAPQGSPDEPPSATMSLKSVDGVDDEALVGPNGKTVYLFEADKDGKPTCAGPCAEDWPPVMANGTPAAGSGLDASLLGTVKRPGGGMQVTYGGHPLYYYAADSGPGSAKGEGVDAFGAEWYVLGAKGAKIENDED